MKCERCGKNEANIYIKKITDGELQEEHICQECAKKEQSELLDNFSGNMKNFYLDTIMSGLTGLDFKDKTSDLEVKKCPVCNSTYKEISDNWDIGCSECYITFRDELDLVLKKINGTSKHVGRIPKRFKKTDKEKTLEEQIKEKTKELQLAVEQENYEYAAILRDQIKGLSNTN